jgi:hypothetical protein
MDPSKLATRVAQQHLRQAGAGGNLQNVFIAAHEEMENKLARELSSKWTQEIETKFGREFPLWEVNAEIEFVRGKQEDDHFRVHLRIAPSSRHPDKDWLYELDPDVGKEIDRWVMQEFGFYTSFWDTAMDMARGTREFPAYNGGPTIQFMW